MSIFTGQFKERFICSWLRHKWKSKMYGRLCERCSKYESNYPRYRYTIYN